MALHFVRRDHGLWKSATPLDRKRNEPLGFDFDEYPESWPKMEAWDLVDDDGVRRYEMMCGSPDHAYIWVADTTNRVAVVIQGWLNLEDRPNDAFERELVRAILEARSKKDNKGTRLAEICCKEPGSAD
jgi:hypothetical protein